MGLQFSMYLDQTADLLPVFALFRRARRVVRVFKALAAADGERAWDQRRRRGQFLDKGQRTAPSGCMTGPCRSAGCHTEAHTYPTRAGRHDHTVKVKEGRFENFRTKVIVDR